MRGLLSVFCLAVLIESASAQDTTKDQALYPLKKGAKWTYKSNKGTIEVSVKGTMKIGMDEAFELETRFDGTPQAVEFVAVRPDGLYRVKVGTVEVKPALQFLKFPVKKGESWMVTSAYGPETITGKFTIGETEVDWNKEKKKAITVSSTEMTANGQKVSLEYTFVEGIGLFAQTSSLMGMQAKLELIKYEAPKD
jgi:hypothetical protein